MRKFLSILKKYIPLILITIILLIFQATLDLKIPDYTANIIDIGIARSGIENNVYEVVREKELNEVLKYTKDDKDVLKSYELIKKGSNKYNYKILKKENIYVLKSNIDIKSLENKLNKLIVIKNEIKDDNVDNYLKYLSNLPDETIKDLANNYIVDEYKTIGIDIGDKSINYIKTVGFKMIVVALLSMIITIISVYTSVRIATKFSFDLRKNIVSIVMNFKKKDYDKFMTSSLITRSTNDINQIQLIIIMLFRIVVYAPILGILALIKLKGSSLMWVVLLAVILNLLLVSILFILTLPRFKKIQDLIDKINLKVRETLSGIAVIRSFNNESYEEKKFDITNIDLTKLNKFVNKAMSFMMPIMLLVLNGISILIIWVGSYKVNASKLMVGDLIASITYATQIISSFVLLSMISILAPRAVVSTKRICEVFNKENKDVKLEKSKTISKGSIEFKNVSFKYSNASSYALNNINFKIDDGMKVGIIGSVASGKTTLLNLIVNLYDEYEGIIKIDGKDIKEISNYDLRKNISYVLQKGYVFKDTIVNNIKLGNKIEKEKVLNSLDIANLKFNKNEILDKEISQSGINMSGGEKQRLLLARSLSKNSKIYLFDDCFSAIDYKTYKNIIKKLNKSLKNKTVIMTSGRVDFIKDFDLIIVLDNGNIVGCSKHEELLNNCDVYKDLYVLSSNREEV